MKEFVACTWEMLRVRATILLLTLGLGVLSATSLGVGQVGAAVSTSSHDTLESAIRQIGSSNETLVVNSTILISSELVIPKNISIKFEQTGLIRFTENANLIDDGPFIAGKYRCFDVLRKQQVKFGSHSISTVRPEWWYAGTGDYSFAVQEALNSISGKGGILLYSATTYVIGDINTGFNKIRHSGVPGTILKKATSASYIFAADSGGPEYFISDLNLTNLELIGLSTDYGFSEHNHLLKLNGVNRASITGCKFKAFEGDAIYIGSGSSGQIRHNLRITIKNCEFDGVNFQNRNGISIIDGYEVLISNCTFTHCSKPNMPGQIDIEPNPDHTYHKIGRIQIVNNSFLNNGGLGSICLVIGDMKFNDWPSGFFINNNTIRDSINSGVFLLNKATKKDMQIVVRDNYVTNTPKPYSFSGVENVLR